MDTTSVLSAPSHTARPAHPMEGRFLPSQRVSAMRLLSLIQIAVDDALAAGKSKDDIFFGTDVDGVVYDTGRTAVSLRAFIAQHLQGHPACERLFAEVSALFGERRAFYAPEDNWAHLVEIAKVFPNADRVAELAETWPAAWRRSFFTNSGVMNDRLIPDVQPFLWQVKQCRARIIHVTGRHLPEVGGPFSEGMLAGTRQAFARDTIPCDELVGKPSWSMRDDEFKGNWFEMVCQMGSPHLVGYMDNEPGNVVRYLESARTAGRKNPIAVYVHTTCSKPVDLPPDVYVLDSFSLTA